jgi:hypothetical protein
MASYESTFLEIINHFVQKHGDMAQHVENIAVQAQGKIRGPTNLDILQTFPLYTPNSAGEYADRAQLTIQTINQIFPFLALFSESINGELLKVEEIDICADTELEKQSASLLKDKFDHFGSDKANKHNYHQLYGKILSNRNSIKNILEIGLGTNNTDVVSSMGVNGRPGASLRAFKEFCPQCQVTGADVDKRVLFNEDRINTYYIDQTDLKTFDALVEKIERNSFDLVIDDGLHSVNANISSLRFGLAIVKAGGWVVIEDIDKETLCLWQLVASILPSKYQPRIFKDATGSLVFAVHRLH